MKMDVSEIIGILISLLIFVLFVGKSVWDLVYRLLKPAEYAKKEEARQQKLQELLKTLNIDEGLELKEKKVAHQPKPHRPRAHLHKHSQSTPKVVSANESVIKSPHKESAYSLERSAVRTRAQKLLRKGSLKDAIILREVLGPPKSLRF